jgi:UDP-glucose 4-epimerase
VSVYARVYGLRTVNVRLFPTYGPRQRQQVIYDLMCKVRDNPDELFIYGDGTQVRDFNYVTDAVEALLLVVERGSLTGDVYNVAADDWISIQQLAEMICERMRVAPRFTYSGTVRAGESQRWVADTSKLRALGYRPRIPLAEGLHRTVAWFDDEGAP